MRKLTGKSLKQRRIQNPVKYLKHFILDVWQGSEYVQLLQSLLSQKAFATFFTIISNNVKRSDCK